MTALSLVGFAMMGLGICGLYVAGSLFSRSPLVVVVQLAAVALMVWARITFGRRSFHVAAQPTEGGVVTSGPYRFVRHPIYAAVVLFALAGAAVHPSWPAAALVLAVIAGALMRLFAEERALLADLPGYRDYAARTPRLIPGVF